MRALLAAVALLALYVCFEKGLLTWPHNEAHINAAPEIKRTNTQNLELKNFAWGIDRLNIMTVSFVIKNGEPAAIKDVLISCDHSAASGTMIGQTKKIIYQSVNPNGSIRISNFPMGFIPSQTATTRCEAVSASFAE